MVMDVSGNEGVEEKMVNIYFYFCSLKEIYTSSLNFEDFGENLDYSKFLYIGTFVLLLLFFFSSLSSSSLFFLNEAPKSLLEILMEVATEMLELITKGASNG
jgi:hypothetical protein